MKAKNNKNLLNALEANFQRENSTRDDRWNVKKIVICL